MEIKSQPIQTLIGYMNALELYKNDRAFDAWVIGALDSLFFMKATLLPQDPNEQVEGLDQEIIKALAGLDEERKKRFEKKIQACIKQDAMLVKWYGHHLDHIRKEKNPERELLLNLCDILELYLQRNLNVWAEGALDALRWVKVTLFPYEPKPTDNQMHTLTDITVQRVYKEWQEQFENQLRRRFGHDEMLLLICKELFVKKTNV